VPLATRHARSALLAEAAPLLNPHVSGGSPRAVDSPSLAAVSAPSAHAGLRLLAQGLSAAAHPFGGVASLASNEAPAIATT